MMIVVVLKPGFGALVLALTITGWTPYARLARAVGLEISTQTYIEAAAAIGESELLTMRKHILPNTLGPILAQVFLRFGHTLLTIAGLSYLGIGIQPPTPDWGSMLADAQAYMLRVPTLDPGSGSDHLPGHPERHNCRAGSDVDVRPAAKTHLVMHLFS